MQEQYRADFELAQRAISGDQSAYEAIYRSCHEKIFAACMRMRNENRADAEDSMQDAFVRAFKKLDTYDGKSALLTWLYRIAINEVLQKKRKKTCLMISTEELRKHGERDGCIIQPSRHNQNQADDYLAPADVGKCNDRIPDKLLLQALLGKLKRDSPAFYSAFLLKITAGCEYGEIADIQRTSRTASRNNLQRARRKLLIELARLYGVKTKLIQWNRNLKSSEISQMFNHVSAFLRRRIRIA